MGLLRWLGEKLDVREERDGLRAIVTELADALGVEDEPFRVLGAAVRTREERDYWREQAYQNALDADRAERFASAWKRCARKFRDKTNYWWDGIRDMFPDEPKRASRRVK